MYIHIFSVRKRFIYMLHAYDYIINSLYFRPYGRNRYKYLYVYGDFL